MGVTGPIAMPGIPVKSLVAKRYNEPEKQIIPTIKQIPALRILTEGSLRKNK